MSLCGEVDIALDTNPYHGVTTASDALWMGLSAVTLVGRVHSPRVGVSPLHAAGLDEWIAQSPQDQVRKALDRGLLPAHVAASLPAGASV
jgi:predicted O-linked N-acetylglucosamine transferase (SPINDLY family)